MKIRLNEIPEDGRSYIINRKTGELNEVLRDLIQNNPYEVDLYIRPLNSKDYTVTGTIQTKTPAECSLCAEDFDLEINKKVNEILIPNQLDDRTGKYAKTSVVTDSELSIAVTEYEKMEFELGEYLHEAVALEVPFNPCCTTCRCTRKDKVFVYDEKMGEETKPSPFQALKGLKLN